MTDARREALEKAFDESTSEEAAPPATVVTATETPEPVVQAPVNEAPPEGEVQAREKLAAEGTPPPQKPDEKPPLEGALEPIKAPVSLKPAESAHWDKVPRPVQEAFARREKEMQQALSNTAQARRFVDDFSKIVQPYAHLIQSQNSTPLQAVHNLMATAAGLAQGDMATKAQIVTNIVRQYGIDIQALDNALSKAPQQQVPRVPDAPPAWAQPLFEMQRTIMTAQQQREQAAQEAAAQQVAALASKPFFEEVREDMADLMEMAAKRNVKMTMEEAYEKSIAMNPKYASAMTQRQAAVSVSEAARTLAAARNAASSVRGAPGPGAVQKGAGPTDRRAALEAAFSEHSSN